ncbi:MAG: DNA cytosine methyltransferase [Magnetococcales bacterium]|nr:DNA cytosine methyltransferase [Magnetococcales bacterium]MBF0156100.1 DNA cytosine methyltransferase [Magnetococcales bacterium]
MKKISLSNILLYRAFDRVLRIIRPKAFIVENVSGMERSDFRHLLNNQITRFRSAGYLVEVSRLNASEFGVPQERKRIFIVGIRSDLGERYTFPKPQYGTHGEFACRTIKDAIGDLPEWPEGEFWTESFHWYYLSRNRRRDWDQTSKTIMSHPRHMPLHPVSPKLKKVHEDKWEWEHDGPAQRFSYHEAARLQGLGKGFLLPDTHGMREKYRVIGNAVPPPLFQAVAGALPDIW